MENEIKDKFKNYGIELSDIQIKQFKEYYTFLISENSKYNLTSITNFNDVIEKHFLDSIVTYKMIPKGSYVIDIGSGAGFPGIPLKIIRDDLKIVLLDSLSKRVNFLKQVIDLLSLTNIEAFHGRAEDFIQQNREKFDIVVSRAVAKSSTLAEYSLPFLKIGGYALFYKSQDIEDEIKNSENAICVLGGEIISKELLKINSNKRMILVIKKIKKTPLCYPRGKNLPKTKPIV